MSLNKVNKPFLRQYNFVSSQKHKINIISDTDTVIDLNKASLSINTTHPFDKLSNLKSEQYESLLILFLRIAYFLGVAPHSWKIVHLENGTKSAEKSCSKFHTIIVIAVHISAFLRYLLRFCLLSYDLKDPFNYFKIARTLLSTSLCAFFMWSLWRRHSYCKQMLDHLANLSYFPNTSRLKRKSFQYPILFVPIGLLCITSVHRAIEECYRRWEDLCGENTFGSSGFCCKQKYEGVRILVKVTFCIFAYFGRTTRRLPRMALLTIALTMWQICKSFAAFLKQRNDQRSHYQNHEIMTVLLAYEELKRISNLTRDIIGEMLVAEIVEDIVYFSLEVQLRLRESDWFSIFVVFETWLVAFLSYFVAACAAEHIQEVSNWLARDDVLAKLSPGKVTTLHIQLSANPIGMKGGSLFTITKSFLANVVTVWVTYFIILLQFHIGVEL